jgi:HTH-type transcriptional regulator / antitoxin HigA
MDATLIVIDSDAELARARAFVDRLWGSDDPADMARLQAQARLIAAYEESKWPRRPPSTAELIRHLMDQHGLTRADMVPLLGTPSRVSEVLVGKKELSIDDGAAIACTLPCARRPAHSTPKAGAKDDQAGRGLKLLRLLCACSGAAGSAFCQPVQIDDEGPL